MSRLSSYGLRVADGPVASRRGSVPDLAAAIRALAGGPAFVAVADRGSHPLQWRRRGPDWLAEAGAEAAELSRPMAVVVLPATAPVRPGPVAVVSPTAAASSYELFLGGAIAAATRYRVEHVNGRGGAGSVLHSNLAARRAVWAAVVGWHERAHSFAERGLRSLASRPAVIVLPVPPGSADAAPVIADHPDADVLLVFDAVHTKLGGALAAQVSAMVELALGVELSLPGQPNLGPEPSPDPGSERMASTGLGQLSGGPEGTASPGLGQPSGGPELTASPEPGHPATPAPPYPEPEPHEDAAPATPPSGGPLPAIRASDVVHVRLTDGAVELTNRTAQHVAVRITLGSQRDPSHARAEFTAQLRPGAAYVEPTAAVPAIADLTAPAAVLRHWSHGSAQVYEGGERRILDVEVAIRDDAGTTVASQVYPAGNGLDFSLTARALGRLVGSPPARPVLPEPVRARPEPTAPARLFAALDAALTAAASVLAAGRRW